MNFVFISPQFPSCFWNFCDRLHHEGVNVLGIGDAPYDNLRPELKAALTEYYYVNSLEDYDQVYRAMAYLAWKHGKIDWVESNNEYWLRQDARLREDFNITTGPDLAQIETLTSKARMKEFYAKAGVPSARQHRGGSLDDAKWFAGEVGYPLIAKPEVGMGASDTFRITSDEELARLWERPDHGRFVLEEYVTGDIYSYDAILDSHSEPLFENSLHFPPSMMDIVTDQLDLVYYAYDAVPEALKAAGRATVKAFGIKSRFVHLEFFRLAADKPGLGAAGDFVGLEVNARCAGGDSPDLFNYAHATDVFQIWAEMIAHDERRLPDNGMDHFCVYAGRRDFKHYALSHEQVLAKYGYAIASHGRNSDALADDMGNEFFMAHMPSEADALAFAADVQCLTD